MRRRNLPKRSSPTCLARRLFVSLVVSLVAFCLPYPAAWAWLGDSANDAEMASAEKTSIKYEYRDIYLTQNRVCKACRYEWMDKDPGNARVRLVNRAGQASIVPSKQIIGIDRHPIVRKIYLKSLYGIGLPGPIIVPAAFEDGNDYVCKYCDTFNR